MRKSIRKRLIILKITKHFEFLFLKVELVFTQNWLLFIVSYFLSIFIDFIYIFWRNVNVVILCSISNNSNTWISCWFVFGVIFDTQLPSAALLPHTHMQESYLEIIWGLGRSPVSLRGAAFASLSPIGMLPIWNYFKLSSLIQSFQTIKT